MNMEINQIYSFSFIFPIENLANLVV